MMRRRLGEHAHEVVLSDDVIADDARELSRRLGCPVTGRARRAPRLYTRQYAPRLYTRQYARSAPRRAAVPMAVRRERAAPRGSAHSHSNGQRPEAACVASSNPEPEN
jgi:hypothetical protein